MCAITAWNPACWSDSRTSSSTSGLVLKMAMMRDFPSKEPSGATGRLRRLRRASKLCPCSLVLSPRERQLNPAALAPPHARAERAAVRLRGAARERKRREIGQAAAVQLAAVADKEGDARGLPSRIRAEVDGGAGTRDLQRRPEDAADGGTHQPRVGLDREPGRRLRNPDAGG